MKFIFAALMIFGIAPAFGAQNLDVSAFEKLAIQDGGRLKPFDTYARESVQLITGKQNYQGKNATELVLSWVFFPKEWSVQKFFQVKHLELKKVLGLSAEDNFIAPENIVKNPQVEKLFSEVERMLRDKKKLDPYYTAVSRLRNQIYLYNEIISGMGIKLVPQKLSQDWLAIGEFKDENKDQFSKIAQGYFTAITRGDVTSFTKAANDFKAYARAQAPAQYPTDKLLNMEISYNSVHPFQKAYIFYFLGALLFGLALQLKPKGLYYAGLAAVVVGWIIHTIGFAQRCIIAERPPVSNMYEVVIWVSLGCVFFGLMFEFIYKKKYFALAASLMGGLCLIVGDAVPAVLDQSIRPLEPVLRSNLWLTVHVLTITLSYAAFTLATGLGNIALYTYARGLQNKQKEKLQMLALYVYRSVQVGVLLLTAGTILGGVWADYSWGRFWGWDPKETWALIADLCYLAVLHGRFIGLLKTFGTIAATVCCYTAVLMASYGVNFILGQGKHSYGFGSGGVHYVAAVVAVQLMFVGFAYWQYRKLTPSKA